MTLKSFDYHKWVTENKHGKGKGYSYKPLNENAVIDTHPDFGQGPCYVCATSSAEVSTNLNNNTYTLNISPDDPYTWKIIQVDNYGENPWDETSCYSTEAGPFLWGSFNINIAGSIYGTDNGCALTASNNPDAETTITQSVDNTGGNTVNTGSNLFFCCDINAINFGKTTNGIDFPTTNYTGPYDSAEEYLMYNGPLGDLCDNSICYGDVTGEPDPEGMPTLPDTDKAGVDSGGDSDQQAQQADKAFKKKNRRRGDRRDQPNR